MFFRARGASEKARGRVDMAGDEPEVIEVIERAFAVTLPGAPVELILADNSHAHLTRRVRARGPRTLVLRQSVKGHEPGPG